ncbi:MAG: hypothetical protein KF805_08050, partial [Phycisphaeraceae bacterium]|nr:hypothetical protein [Phycisphaeraceae bacterium]
MRLHMFVCATALFALVLPAAAQTCAVKNHMRLVNRVNGGTEPEVRIDTGWQTVASGTSLVTPGSAYDSSPLGTSQGSWTSTSTYGSLAFSGSGSGTNSPGNGIFLWLDEWIGGEP